MRGKGGGMRGLKKPGAPHEQSVQRAELIDQVMGVFVLDLDPRNRGMPKASVLTVSQNSRSRSTRFSGGLPAISAALMAPIEMPATQSG